MPTPEEEPDLSVDNCVARVEAIPHDSYVLYVYHTSRLQHYKVLAQGKAIPIDDIVEGARAADDTTFVDTVELEVQTSIRIKDAIEMTKIAFRTNAEAFVNSHSRLLGLLETTPRMRVVGSTTIRFFKGHTQIRECTVSQRNMRLYTAYHRIHHIEDIDIDDRVAEFTRNNELIHHYQSTRNTAHFKKMGCDLKDALKTILLWTTEHVAGLV